MITYRFIACTEKFSRQNPGQFCGKGIPPYPTEVGTQSPLRYFLSHIPKPLCLRHRLSIEPRVGSIAFVKYYFLSYGFQLGRGTKKFSRGRDFAYAKRMRLYL